MAHPEAQAEIDRLGLLVQGFQREDHMNRTYRATEALLRSVPSFSDDNTALFRDHEVTLIRYFRTREAYLVDEVLKKNCLLESLRGRALLRIRENPELDRIYRLGTFVEYLDGIRAVFSPDSEKVLVRSEFDQYAQKRTQDISSYFSNKVTLFMLAFGEAERSFDYLRVSVLAGMINKEVRHEVRRKNPRDIEALRAAVLECTAAERDAYSGGYSNSTSSDGLSTISSARKQMDMPGDEMMEVDGLGSSNDRKCHRCGRNSHLQKDCIAKKDVKGNDIMEHNKGSSKPFSKPFSKPGGGRGRGGSQGRGPSDRSAKTCHSCGRVGHLKRDCRSKKQPNAAIEEAEEEGEDCWDDAINNVDFLGYRPTGTKGRKSQH